MILYFRDVRILKYFLRFEKCRNIDLILVLRLGFLEVEFRFLYFYKVFLLIFEILLSLRVLRKEIRRNVF